MAEVSVTLKRTGRDEPWIVIRGEVAEVKVALVQAFNLESKCLSYDLGSLTSVCQSFFNGGGNAISGLGARPVTDEDETPPPFEGGTKVEQEADEDQWLFDALTAATTLEAVKQVWAENRPTFDSNPALEAAMKKRWAELKESND
jgi:hypothetical protein